MVKGDSNNHWSIKWGDAQAGPLHTAFDGPRPQQVSVSIAFVYHGHLICLPPAVASSFFPIISPFCIVPAGLLHLCMSNFNSPPPSLRAPRPTLKPLYNPMKKPGGLILGMGGDTSPHGIGTFYEGVVTKGYSSDEADDALQANIVAAKYGS